MKASKKMKMIAMAFFFIAVISILGGIVLAVSTAVADVQTVIMWFISGLLWTFCGIILYISARLKKTEEDQKPKINAFNYGKKNLHKKAKR